ncbi:MAG: hypothetical protein IPK83_24620 [Planctomycetes bacterium]|nr:hypothetical protein [Planctomycetota bacterium]
MMSRFDLSHVVKRNGWAGFPAYADSELANVLFTLELAKRLSGTSAIANCFHQVLRGARVWQEQLLADQMEFALGQALVARTTEKGRRNARLAGNAPDAAQYSGQYFFGKLARVHAHGDDEGLAGGFGFEYEAGCCGTILSVTIRAS